MTTETKTIYKLKIIETRPNLNVNWYEFDGKWKEAWREFNEFENKIASTFIDETGSEKSVEINQIISKVTIFPNPTISEDGLIKTREYLELTKEYHDELLSALNNEESGLYLQKAYDIEYGITHNIVSEHEEREILILDEPIAP
jgi:predicted nucleotide-binding protein (sugar kinase/HSP70/actin superfamily)